MKIARLNSGVGNSGLFLNKFATLLMQKKRIAHPWGWREALAYGGMGVGELEIRSQTEAIPKGSVGPCAKCVA